MPRTLVGAHFTGLCCLRSIVGAHLSARNFWRAIVGMHLSCALKRGADFEFCTENISICIHTSNRCYSGLDQHKRETAA